MLRYVCKRIVYLIFVFFIMSVLLFIIYTAVPGDPARIRAEKYKSKDAVQYQMAYDQAREDLGLDKPLPVRYFSWMGQMLKGDFGYSTYYSRDVAELVVTPMKNTIILNIGAMVLALLITIPLGISCAVRRGGVYDNVIRVLTVIGYSIPQFIIGLVFIYVFAVKLGWFPVSGFGTANFSGTFWEEVLDKAKYMTLPLLVMTFSSLGGMTKYVRSAMIDSLNMDFVRTARAKGLREQVVVYVHAFRSALLPVITLIIGWFFSIFGGSLIIENMFALNGMGKVYINCLQNQDYQVVLTLQMFYIIIGLIGNLVIDLSYGLADPRVKLN